MKNIFTMLSDIRNKRDECSTEYVIWKIKDIYNFYDKHKENDPNMYELMEVLCEASRCPIGEGNDNNISELDFCINTLTKLELDRLISNGIIENTEDSLIQMVLEFRDRALSRQAVRKDLEDYAKKVAGVSFWIKTNEAVRDEPFEPYHYQNEEEFLYLLYLRDSVGSEEPSQAVNDTMQFITHNSIFSDLSKGHQQKWFHLKK